MDDKRKKVRILSYGYSTELFVPGKSAKSTKPSATLRFLPQALFLHATRLIEQLATYRSKACEDRPIIFIAHSLGGFIVKTALVHASAAIDDYDSELKAIELLTVGILFFGTPQQESKSTSWNRVLKKMYSLAEITPSTMSNDRTNDQAEIFNFQVERYKSIESNFYNFSFYEGTQINSKVTNTPITIWYLCNRD